MKITNFTFLDSGKRIARKRCSYPPDAESTAYHRRSAPSKLQNHPQYLHFSQMQYTGTRYLPQNATVQTPHHSTYATPLHRHFTQQPKPSSPSPLLVLPDVQFDADTFLANPSSSNSSINTLDSPKKVESHSPKSQFSSIIDNILDDFPEKLINLEFPQSSDDSLQYDLSYGSYLESVDDWFENLKKSRSDTCYTDFIEIEDLDEPPKKVIDVEIGELTHNGS